MAALQKSSKSAPIPKENWAMKTAIFTNLTVMLGAAAIFWGIVCLFFGWYAAAAIPLTYTAISALNLLIYRRFKTLNRCMLVQSLLSVMLPFIFQFVLGGWQNTGIVMLWSVVPLLAIVAYGTGRYTAIWTASTAAVMIVSLWPSVQLTVPNVVEVITPSIKGQLLTFNLVMITMILALMAKTFLSKLDEARKAGSDLRTSLSERNDHLEKSLSYAKRIQRALTPDLKNVRHVLDDQFQIIQQKEEVGGDMLWVGHEGDHVIVALIDCTGHGVPGSMLTVLVNDIMNESVHFMKFTEAKDLVLRLMLSMHDRLESSSEIWTDNADIGLLSFNRKTGEANFSGCGVDLLMHTSENAHLIKGQSTILGMKQLCDRPQQQETLFLDPTDTRLYLASDGVFDLFGGDDDSRFGSQRYLDMIRRVKDQEFQSQRETILGELNAWKGKDGEQTDDITLIGLQVSKSFLTIPSQKDKAQSA